MILKTFRSHELRSLQDHDRRATTAPGKTGRASRRLGAHLDLAASPAAPGTADSNQRRRRPAGGSGVAPRANTAGYGEAAERRRAQPTATAAEGSEQHRPP